MSCDKSMSFEECEIQVLRNAVDSIEKAQGVKLVQDPEIKKIIETVEDFIRKEKLICYGGTAINNLLPDADKFYDLSVELPDYDVYSNNAMNHAIKLADIYSQLGFDEVEARSGMHHGTYKVFVNYLPVADITQISNAVYKNMLSKVKTVNGLKYTPINYLRMNMYKELSRPQGDVSRWEKVLKRLVLFNKSYPLIGSKCKPEDIQRTFEDTTNITSTDVHKLYMITRDSFISQGLVFFGSFAGTQYLKHLKHKHFTSKNIPDFDVLSIDPERSAKILKETLLDEGFRNITVNKKKGVDEIIAPHYEIKIDNETIAFIYKPIDCHSYNTVKINGKQVKIASIDTMLNLYLAFLYAERPYYNTDRIYCLCEYMFKIQQKNRLRQKGVLKRFSVNCYGEPITIQHILKERQEKFKELKSKRGTREYNLWFLRYKPNEPKKKVKSSKNTKKRTIKSKIKSVKKNVTRKNLLNLFRL